MIDDITINRIQALHPDIRCWVEHLYRDVSKLLPKGVMLRFTSTHRTNEEQHKLFLQRPKVTNADSGQSIHNYGLAFDIVLIVNGKASWSVDSNWMLVAKFFKDKGFTWGGDFKSMYDAPHFEYNYGKTWKDFIKMETFTSNGIKYPKL